MSDDNDDIDNVDHDDGNDNGVIQKSKKKNGTTSHSSNQQKRLPTSEYDPFDLEKDFLGEIDAVLNDASDDDIVSITSDTEPTVEAEPTEIEKFMKHPHEYKVGDPQ